MVDKIGPYNIIRDVIERVITIIIANRFWYLHIFITCQIYGSFVHCMDELTNGASCTRGKVLKIE